MKLANEHSTNPTRILILAFSTSFLMCNTLVSSYGCLAEFCPLIRVRFDRKEQRWSSSRWGQEGGWAWDRGRFRISVWGHELRRRMGVGYGIVFNLGVSKCVFWCILWPTWIWFCSSCYFLLMLSADLLTMDDYDNYNWVYSHRGNSGRECVLPSSTTSRHSYLVLVIATVA